MLRSTRSCSNGTFMLTPRNKLHAGLRLGATLEGGSHPEVLEATLEGGVEDSPGRGAAVPPARVRGGAELPFTGYAAGPDAAYRHRPPGHGFGSCAGTAPTA